MSKQRGHSASVLRALVVVAFVFACVVGIAMTNVFGLRESSIDLVERFAVSTGIIDDESGSGICSASVQDCSYSDDMIKDQDDALAFVCREVGISAEGQMENALTSLAVKSSAGLTFYRFGQAADGVPVYGRGATVAVMEDGSPVAVSSNCVSFDWSGNEGSVDADEAADIAKNEFGKADVLDKTSVLYVRDSGAAEKAWAIDCSTSEGIYEVVVSSESGNVLAEVNGSDEAASDSSANSTARSTTPEMSDTTKQYRYADERRHIYILDGKKLGKTKPFDWARSRLAARGDSGHIYRNVRRDGEYIWADENDDEVKSGLLDGAPWFGESKDLSRYFLDDTQGVWLDEEDSRANSLRDSLALVYDFYSSHYGFNGADGRDGSVYGFVSANVDSAQRDGPDGNPYMTISVNNQKKYYTLSTFAHEYTHGAVSAMRDLSADETSEAKSVNEAISDIMSYVVRDEVDNGQFDNSIEWCMEGIGRRADKPGISPSEYKGLWWWHNNGFIEIGSVLRHTAGERYLLYDCHHNRTVLSHAAYLMCGDNNLSGAAITTEQLGLLTFLTMNMLSSNADFHEFARLFALMAMRLAKTSGSDMNAARAQRVLSAFAEVNLSVDDIIDASGSSRTDSDKSEKTKSAEKTSSLKPADVVLVLDASGSMEGKPEAQVIKAGKRMLDDINVDGARFGACIYNSELVASSELVSDKAAAIDTIEAMRPSGGTDIGCGLSGGRDLLMAASPDSAENRRKTIVLMSDGLPTSGEDAGQIKKRAEKYRGEGIKVYALGFNLDASGQSLMRSIASEGCYFNVVDDSELEGFFEDIAAEINGVRYSYIRIACPVAVSVTGDGETLSSVDGGNRRTSFGTIQIEDASDGKRSQVEQVKVLRLRADGEYQVEIDGTGSGDMTVECSYMDDGGDYNDRRTFTDVSVNASMKAIVGIDDAEITRMTIDDDGDGLVDRSFEASVNSEAQRVDNSLPIKAIYGGLLAGLFGLTALAARRTINRMKGIRRVLS